MSAIRDSVGPVVIGVQFSGWMVLEVFCRTIMIDSSRGKRTVPPEKTLWRHNTGTADQGDSP